MPFISIVIPVYNDEANICKLIESLLKINYPVELREIIIVDNNSTDRTKKYLKQYNLKYYEEKKIQSSYAARNKGIKYSKGEIIAFTDSDCIVKRDWLQEAIKVLNCNNADLVAGKIDFYFSEKESAAEYYDSITYMQNEIYVKEKKIACTANLIVRKKIFDEIGLFPIVKSGGDGIWTSKAVDNGYRLFYSPSVIVNHPARTASLLLKKAIRIGKGAALKEIRNNFWVNILFYEVFKRFIPCRIANTKKTILQRGTKKMMNKVYRIWMISYLCRIFVATGFIMGLWDIFFKNYFRSNSES